MINEIKQNDQLSKLLLKIGELQDYTSKEIYNFTAMPELKPHGRGTLHSYAFALVLYCGDKKNAGQSNLDPMDVVRHPMGESYKAIAQLLDASAWYKGAIATCGNNRQCAAIANRYREHVSACSLHSSNKAACDAVKQDANDWVQMKSSSNQISSNDPVLNKWVAESLSWCGSNTACSTIVNSYQAHTTACSRGDQQACVDRDRDLNDWEVLNANVAGTAQVSGDAKMQCLQSAMRQAVESCRRQNCPLGDILDQVRLQQQALCGFSAIEPSKPWVAPAPQFPTTSDCSYTPRAGGGFNSNCTHY